MSSNNNYNLDLSQHIEENHASKNAKYIKSIVYGGLDGIITTFSIIAAAVGASLEMKYIISLGIANLFSDGLSMGLGDYLSETFENDYIKSERDKEIHEYEVNRDYEIQELKELFEEEGLQKEDSEKIVDILASKEEYKDVFIKYMLSLELGLELGDQDPKVNGLITFFSFIIFGSVPVLFYVIFYLFNYDNYESIFIINCFVSMITMFGLGVFQAKITKQNKVKGGLLVMFNGIVASSVAYLVGYSIQESLN